jgi:hypothetical protein
MNILKIYSKQMIKALAGLLFGLVIGLGATEILNPVPLPEIPAEIQLPVYPKTNKLKCGGHRRFKLNSKKDLKQRKALLKLISRYPIIKSI